MAYYTYVLLKFIIGFSIVLAHLNLSGKTQLSQMTPVDFIGNFVIGGIIGGVIYNEDISLHRYILVLLISVCLISFLNVITKKINLFRNIAIGNPLPIIKNGQFVMKNILEKRNKIDILSIMSQLRIQGIHSFQEINYAQIEPSGQITTVVNGSKMPSLILIKDGSIREHELEEIGKSEEWLKEQIQKQGITNIEDIFLAEYWNGEVNFVLQDGKLKHKYLTN